ncbi:TraL conjugative transposon family protein [Alistipes finegoldii]|uniref:TraL conjugative transposon family protein n=1 Tax=Alistipes finegoldii TaxID=214856 RepID=UPI003A93DB90
MRKLIGRLNALANKQDERFRCWLEALPQRMKIIIVLSILSLFALCALFSIGAACYRIGRERGIEIEHIKQLDLPQKQDSIHLFNNNDYDTEQESHNLPERGEA